MPLAQDPISPLLQYGAVGIIAALALTAVVVLWRREVTRAEATERENEELRKEVRDLNAELRHYLLMIPRTTETIDEAVSVLRRSQR